jgi:hypothetical protein
MEDDYRDRCNPDLLTTAGAIPQTSWEAPGRADAPAAYTGDIALVTLWRGPSGTWHARLSTNWPLDRNAMLVD